MKCLAAFGVLSALAALAAVGGAVVGCSEERYSCFAVSCGENYDANTDPDFNYDAGRPPPEQYDATPVPWDAASGLGCSTRPGWQVVQPFPWIADCAIQLAPKSALAAAQLPLRPCRNGMAKCTEIVIPRRPGSLDPGAIFAIVNPVQPGSDDFVLRFTGDPGDPGCMDSQLVHPNGVDLELRGGAAVGSMCPVAVQDGAGQLSLGYISTSFGGISVRDWNTGAPRMTSPSPFATVSPYVSGDTAYMHSPLGNLELFDLPTGAHLWRPLHDGMPVAFATPMFALEGDLWVHGWDEDPSQDPTAKGTYWRITRDGYFPMLNKAGVDIEQAATDGTTLFWVELEKGVAKNPRTEIWKAPFSKDAAALRAAAQKVADITGATLPAPEKFEAPAHAGYYALATSQTEMIVVRGSDGATQRVPISPGLPGNWGRLHVAYVDATQIWFAHGGHSAFDVGVARIELNPWP